MSEPSRHLSLDRPLAVVDLETTGVDPRADRIVAIGVLTLVPDGQAVPYEQLVHPGMLIPAAAVAIHGIDDAAVADQPPFRAIAGRLVERLDGCDLAGFNLKRFDLPFLVAELARAGRELPLAGRSVVDVLQIYHRREPRDLATAVRFYRGREHTGAHGALADARAAAEVLDAQVGLYADLPATPAGLHAALTDVDLGGRFRTEGDRVVFAFGKHSGRPLDEVARRDPGYLQWFLAQDFWADAKGLVAHALARVAPGSRP